MCIFKKDRNIQSVLSIEQGFFSLEQLESAIDNLFRTSTTPHSSTYVSILQACSKRKALSLAKRVHSNIVFHKVSLNGFLGDYLVMTLAKCGAVNDAWDISCSLSSVTIFSWTAIICAHVDTGCHKQALDVYLYMQKKGIEPDSYTFVSLFKACASIRDLGYGNQLYARACKKGLTSIPHIDSALIRMYGKCGAIVEAVDVFCRSKDNYVSWTTMMSVLLEQCKAGDTISLYRQMLEEGLNPDPYALVFAIHACTVLVEEKQATKVIPSVKPVEIVRGLHSDAWRNGYAYDNVFVGTALISAYGKCGFVCEAENVFSKLTKRNVVTWNAMLSSYVEQDLYKNALSLFTEMHNEMIKPEELTFIIILQACHGLAGKGKLTSDVGRHTSLCILQAFQFDPYLRSLFSSACVATAIIGVYMTCGAVAEAESVFRELKQRDVAAWNAMLSGYLEKGEAGKALHLYNQMQEDSVMQDNITLMCMLLVCSEGGDIEVCKQLHFVIVSSSYDLLLSMVSALIYGYGNCARTMDARICFDQLPYPDTASWNACLAGYAGEGDLVASLTMFEILQLTGSLVDAITFTSVLAACTNTSYVNVGLNIFGLIGTCGITPDIQHYSILIDLLGRAGDFRRIENLLENMQMLTDPHIWLFLLGACRTHNNIGLAQQAYHHATVLQPIKATAHVLMSNIYADIGLQFESQT